jgi:hypothetical protein
MLPLSDRLEQLDAEMWGMLAFREAIGTDVLAIFAAAGIILRAANRGLATAPDVTAAALMVLAEAFGVAHDTSDAKLARFRRALEEAQAQLPPRSIPAAPRRSSFDA